MSNQQIRQEIDQIISRLPEETLSDVLSYLKRLEELGPEEKNRMKLFEQILKEDAKLLKRLAQ